MDIVFFDVNSKWYAHALKLRDAVLRKPLGLSFTQEELKRDEHDLHVAAIENGKLLACLTLSDTGDKSLKIRQVAVCPQRQRKGLGTALNTAAEEYARSKGYVMLYCHARITAASFYERLGFKRVGEEFTEVTIPHIKMVKIL
ncbi:MAG: GNAT family N-acetyltransferase [Chitinophagales bacterium]|nr:GNAT family N-acetyltransferase [Chitinophagales bacterium]MDW8419093.1 GNAT family N-acetyltransferase [Chitinophagales bacterium]